MEQPIANGRPLRRHLGRHRKGVALHSDTVLHLRAFAQKHHLTWSGAIHELVRTHPAIGLPSLLLDRENHALSPTTKP